MLVGVVLISGVVGTWAYGANPALGVALGLGTALCYSGYLLPIRIGGRDPRRTAGPGGDRDLRHLLVARLVGLVSGDLDVRRPPPSLGWLCCPA